MNETQDWIDSAAACGALGIRPQTLYAYASRGLLRAAPDPGDPRKSLYSHHDVMALKRRKTRSRRRADVATGTIAFGEPVLESAISTVRDGRLIYRGRDAVELSQSSSLEETAALLWQAPRALFAPLAFKPSEGASAKARAFACLAARAASDPPTLGRTAQVWREDAWTILSAVADAFVGRPSAGAIHERLAAGWGVPRAKAGLIRQCLVLTADHELNPSTFAVRVAASTGASLAGAVLAGLAALNGPRHGEAAAQALRNLREILRHKGPAAHYIGTLLQKGDTFLAFGHPLYPDGDPRAAALMSALGASTPSAGVVTAAERILGRKANIDMGIAALTHQLKLPDEAPFVLFALGRVAGWLAHAMEQAETGALIRPRARYVGI